MIIMMMMMMIIIIITMMMMMIKLIILMMMNDNYDEVRDGDRDDWSLLITHEMLSIPDKISCPINLSIKSIYLCIHQIYLSIYLSIS